MIIAVDFDGTIVEDRYPEIGKERPFATITLRKLIEHHHKLILWTVREGQLLDEAVEWCRNKGIEFYAVNKDYEEEDPETNKHFSRKIKADVFIDDRNVGGLLDWGSIYEILVHKNLRRVPARRGGKTEEKEMVVVLTTISFTTTFPTIFQPDVR